MHVALESAMLFRFRNPRRLEEGYSPPWQQVIGMSVDVFRETFIERVLLRGANAHEALIGSQTVVTLRQFAKERGLAISGSKSTLAARLLAHGPPRPPVPDDFLIWTEAGRIRFEQFQTERESARSSALQSISAYLTEGNVRGALALVRGYQKQWHEDDLFPTHGLFLVPKEAERLAETQWILTRTPALLRSLPDDLLAVCRTAAALAALGFPDPFRTLTKRSATAFGTWEASHMWEHAARAHFERQSLLRDFPTARGELLSFDDALRCQACRTASDKVMPLAQLPPLPHPQCTSPAGCRCTAVFYTD
jgi:hypothetical protein